MRIILLLLLTLTGPFCTFTQASPTVPPTHLETSEPKSELSPTAVIKQTEGTSPPVASTQTAVPKIKIATTTEGVPAVSTDAASTAVAETTEAGTEEKNGTQSTNVTAAYDVEEPGVKKDNNKETESKPVEHIENDEGMGTGQVVGIVIGALIGVIVVIAIIILVVRRMGQYSP